MAGTRLSATKEVPCSMCDPKGHKRAREAKGEGAARRGSGADVEPDIAVD